jgi:hypothetical protein
MSSAPAGACARNRKQAQRNTTIQEKILIERMVDLRVGVDGIGDDDLTLNRRIGRSGPNRYSIRWLRFHQSLPVSMGTCSDDLKWNSHLPGFRFVLVGMETNRAIAALLSKNEDRQMRFRK